MLYKEARAKPCLLVTGQDLCVFVSEIKGRPDNVTQQIRFSIWEVSKQPQQDDDLTNKWIHYMALHNL